MSELAVQLNTAELEVIEPSKAKQIRETFVPMAEMLEDFEDSYNQILKRAKKDIDDNLMAEAKRLRIDIGKVRIQTDKLRKEQKAEYLRAGQAIDAVAKILTWAVSDKEEKLKEIEKHAEIKEAERLQALQDERVKKLIKYLPEAENMNLSDMADDVWEAYFKTKKQEYEDKKKAEAEAEKQRIEAEKERKRKEKEAQERIKKLQEEAKAKEEKARKEREALEKEMEEKLKKEREEREKLRKEAEEKAKKERAERLAREKEEKKKAEKERKEREAMEAKLKALEEEKKAKAKAEKEAEQKKLKAGDKEKIAHMKDTIISLGKMEFKSDAYQFVHEQIKKELRYCLEHIESLED